jgi:adenylylsulfate kinase-like enzyme
MPYVVLLRYVLNFNMSECLVDDSYYVRSSRSSLYANSRSAARKCVLSDIWIYESYEHTPYEVVDYSITKGIYRIDLSMLMFTAKPLPSTAALPTKYVRRTT